MRMRRQFQIRLEDIERKKLAELAKKNGISSAALIRVWLWKAVGWDQSEPLVDEPMAERVVDLDEEGR